MRIVKDELEIFEVLKLLKAGHENAKNVGFVPTMGALHEGHISLIDLANKECDIVICSIFVNPTQFNNPDDLKTYPRTIEADIALLEQSDCDILLLPDVDAVYPNGVTDYEIDLGGLDNSMEGEFRPGHFKGVCMVVERFFEMVKPDRAYFGKKDFQQLAIIRKMVSVRNLGITIVGAPIKRLENGLAMSSRNALLTETERQNSSLIYKALLSGTEMAKSNKNANVISDHIASFFQNTEMEIEYIAIIDNDTLKFVEEINSNTTVCIVVYHSQVRLLDNMQFS